MRPPSGAAAVVTGAGSGIGRATALRLAAAGMRVGGIGRTESKLRDTAEAVSRGGGEMHVFAADLRRAADATAAIDGCAAALGGIDLLVNNAGIYREGPFSEIPDATVDDLLDVNVKALVFTTRAALRWMRPGSCIVNVASMSAVRALPEQCLYAASKAAVVHLGVSLAAELAPRSIRVNTVSPGPTRTPIVATVAPEEKVPEIEAHLASIVPLRRIAEPEEVAEAVEYVAAAEFATGAHLVVDGGVTL